jgi:hypothetical protein
VTARLADSFLACYPCRKRKVKCDGSLPCRRCVESDSVDDYSEPCSYAKLSKRGRLAQDPTTSNHDTPVSQPGTIPEEWEQMKQDLQTMQATISKLRSEIDSVKSNDSDLEGIHAPSAILGTMQYFVYLLGTDHQLTDHQLTDHQLTTMQCDCSSLFVNIFTRTINCTNCGEWKALAWFFPVQLPSTHCPGSQHLV